MYFDSIHRIGIVVLRPLLNYHDAGINWLASHQFVTNLRNPAYHESHQTRSTWVMHAAYISLFKFCRRTNRIFLPTDGNTTIKQTGLLHVCSLVPRPPSEKSRKGLATRMAMRCPRGLYTRANQIAEIIYVTFNRGCANSSVYGDHHGVQLTS